VFFGSLKLAHATHMNTLENMG